MISGGYQSAFISRFECILPFFLANTCITNMMDLLIESRERCFKDFLLHLRLSFLVTIRGISGAFLGAASEAPGNVLDDAPYKALEMNVKFEKIEPSIEPFEIAQDETSANTIVGDIFLLDKSMLHQALAVQALIEHWFFHGAIVPLTFTPYGTL